MRILLTLFATMSSLALNVHSQTLQQDLQAKVATVKESVAKNRAALERYTWTEHTDISLKGEVKKTKDQLCRYGPDGKVVKTEVAESDPKKLHGIRKRIADRKKEELEDYMDRASALIKDYVPPYPEAMQVALQSGKVSLGKEGPAVIQLQFRDYVKPGDSLVFNFDSASKVLRQILVNSYLDDPSDVVKLNVSFQTLPDATNYVAKTVLTAPAKQVEVTTTSSNFQKLAQ